MHILYIHQYFKTPKEPRGTRSYWFSRKLIERGHKVTMITSTSKVHPNSGQENVDGIDVIYVKNSYSNYMSKIQKVKSFVSFMGKAIKASSEVKDVDIMYATSTPLTIGGIALWLKFRRGWKYIFEVRDLWPEFPIQIGAIKNPILKKILRAFERSIYKKSEFVVALSPGMEAGVLKAGTPQSKVGVIPNMSKPEEFYPHLPSKAIINKFGLRMDKFNIIHFGSMGRANGLEYIVEAARIAKEKGCNMLNFIFLGDGATFPILKKKVEENKLDNVQFLGSHPMSTVSEIVNCCDISITSFLDLPILYTNSPNKLFDSLSAGKPIIVNSAGWTKDLVEKENCGFYVNPHEPEELIKKLMNVKDDKSLLNTWSDNARHLSETKFNRSILSIQMAELVERVGSN